MCRYSRWGRYATSGWQGNRGWIVSQYGVATVVMQILLMVGGFNADGGAELILVDVNIDIQEGDIIICVT